MKIVVTGTGRCGTLYMSKLLNSVGISCEHEAIFDRGDVNFRPDLEAESSYMAAPYLDGLPNDTKIIHVVREPMAVINSFVVAFCYFLSGTLEGPANGDWVYKYPPGADPYFRYQKFIYKHVPILSAKQLRPVVRAAWYYVKWNEMIEKKSAGKPYLLHRIEDDIDGVLKFLGKEDGEHVCRVKTFNKVKHERKLNLDSLDPDGVKELLIGTAQRYKYYD